MTEERIKRIKKLTIPNLPETLKKLKERITVDMSLDTIKSIITKLEGIQEGAEKNKGIEEIYDLLKENKIDADSLEGLKVKDFSLNNHTHKEVKDLFDSSYTKKEFGEFKKTLEKDTKGILQGLLDLKEGQKTLKIDLGRKVDTQSLGKVDKRLTSQFLALQAILKGIESGLDMKNKKITNLGTPTKPKDACTKEYADNVAQRAAHMGGGGGGGIIVETDPIFTAWDKSSGISITESQISDLKTYLLDISGQDLSTADNSTSAFITLGDIPAIPSDISELTDNTGIIPTDTNDLTNGAGFITSGDIPAIPSSIDDLSPSQSGNAGKYLKTDGTNATWEDVAGGGGYSVTEVITDTVSPSDTSGERIILNNYVSTSGLPAGYPTPS
jgi:hypothetical protein